MEFVPKEINEALEQEITSGFEATTYNLYKKLTDDTAFAIISPYRREYSEEENLARMAKLKAEVRGLKLGFNQLISRWVEDGQASDEQSLLISNITKEKALELGKSFNQSSIIFKDSTGCQEICTTGFVDEGKTYSPGDVVRVFNTTGNHILNIEEAREIFSKRRGGPASMPIKGNRPFTLKENRAIESFELYEVEQPKPSYFQNKERKIKII